VTCAAWETLEIPEARKCKQRIIYCALDAQDILETSCEYATNRFETDVEEMENVEGLEGLNRSQMKAVIDVRKMWLSRMKWRGIRQQVSCE
jgi:hypothetical protein